MLGSESVTFVQSSGMKIRLHINDILMVRQGYGYTVIETTFGTFNLRHEYDEVVGILDVYSNKFI